MFYFFMATVSLKYVFGFLWLARPDLSQNTKLRLLLCVPDTQIYRKHCFLGHRILMKYCFFVFVLAVPFFVVVVSSAQSKNLINQS